MSLPKVWKNVKVTKDDKPELDLVDSVDLSIDYGASAITTSQGTKFQGTVDKVLIQGVHSSGRRFTVTCTLVGARWNHTGVLHPRGMGGGGEGTWMADEGP